MTVKSSVRAALQQGIEMLRHGLEREDAEQEALMLLLARRRQGDFVESDAMGRRVREMAARKRRDRGLPDWVRDGTGGALPRRGS